MLLYFTKPLCLLINTIFEGVHFLVIVEIIFAPVTTALSVSNYYSRS